MICYRDMSFCSDAEKCNNHITCPRFFSPIEKRNANRWWGSEGAPVAFMPFKESCEDWEELK